MAWHTLLQKGLPFRSFASTAKAIGQTENSFANLIAITPQTLAARKKARRLNAVESDLVYAIARAFVKLAGARGMTGAAAWLTSPALELKQAIPVQLARTRLGTEYVMGAIERERTALIAKQKHQSNTKGTQDKDEEEY